MEIKLHPALQRAQLLAEHKRFAEAERELRQLLAETPEHVYALYILAEILLEQERLADAEEVVHQVLHLQPASAPSHYLHARLLSAQDLPKQAIEAIQQAISLDPTDPDYHGMHAIILFSNRQREAALEAAEKGLSFDPEHINCLNVRSRVLFKLGRKQEAVQTIDKALEQDPGNAITHANYGWAWLEKNDPKQALEHFRAALQLDPTLDYAKEGMTEAMKGRYWLYRQYLRYAFWIANQSKRNQWIFLIGLYVAFRFIRSAADANETLAPFLMPLIVLYILFAFSSWLLGPLGNLFLMLNPYGRYALSESDRRTAGYVGMALATSVAGFISWAIVGNDGLLALGFLGFSMMVPLGSMNTPDKPKDKRFLVIYTLGLLLVGAGAVVLSLLSSNLTNGLSFVYLIGFMAYQWIANAKIMR
ncbi:tetratricopeptide repeat protein [Cesiribacter sp. SM1]|uniref:tetratricopeptide repeat protein n=1 Tax=Cesiribacter sp. SM1 TaxID=2861196 RepID=UPI001CD56842|nr:tetratricopeptide repeat protein [Cesiribacter sp. SM1]